MKPKNALFIYQITPNILKKYVLMKIFSLEGGEWRSNTARAIFFAEYNIKIGYASYGCFVQNMFARNTTIGNYCSFADAIRSFNANHPITEAICHPIFYNKKFGYPVSDVTRSSLVIGHDVWIGQGCIILPSCTQIGNGAIIGAGSIVTKNVDAYSVVAGNPAKEIKKRFDTDTIEILEKSLWWNLKADELFHYYTLRKDAKVFAQQIIDDYHL